MCSNHILLRWSKIYQNKLKISNPFIKQYKKTTLTGEEDLNFT